MRPRQEIRTALARAARALHAEQGGATWLEMATRARVGREKARLTVQDMRRSGELTRLATVRLAHTTTPMAWYGPGPNWAEEEEEPAPAVAVPPGSLDDLVRTWRTAPACC